MKPARAVLLLCITLGAASAQTVANPATPFATAVDTLRATMLKLSSNHKLTNADNKVLAYNVSVLSVSADAPTCTLTWKEKVDLEVASLITTKAVHLDDVLNVKSVSSLNSKMNVDPFIQIVQIHMKPDANAVSIVEHFKGDGSPLGTPDTKRAPVVTIFTASEAEATTVIRQLTDVMTRCTVLK
jgi:hypothetical protein